MSWKVIQVRLNDVTNVMESVGHRSLECGPDILQAKREFLICEGTPRTDKSHLVLISGENVNLIISRKSIHKGKKMMVFRPLKKHNWINLGN